MAKQRGSGTWHTQPRDRYGRFTASGGAQRGGSQAASVKVRKHRVRIKVRRNT